MTAACPKCRSPLIPGLPEGLCPRCLLACVLPLDSAEPATTPHAGFVPPPHADLAPLFPQLEILQLLGQGGMGAVYKARQVKLDRLVALKILPPAVARDAGFAERFGREARALARLSHPNIVAVHDFGEINGLYFLVMEYVEGVNLRQALGVGKLEPKQALGLVGELCSALQYAHEMGVVHRDVKPENILLDRQGHAKVADFGLAKIVGVSRPERLTGTHQVMGTPHYMAPEQWERPLEVDHRADIYSLGVVFYELLTGELPLGKFPPPSQKAGDPRLDQVVLRAIEREPAQRYQQMSEMKSAVESVGAGRTAANPTRANPGDSEPWIHMVASFFSVSATIATLVILYLANRPIDWVGLLISRLFLLPVIFAIMVGTSVHFLVVAAITMFKVGVKKAVGRRAQPPTDRETAENAGIMWGILTGCAVLAGLYWQFSHLVAWDNLYLLFWGLPACLLVAVLAGVLVGVGVHGAMVAKVEQGEKGLAQAEASLGLSAEEAAVWRLVGKAAKESTFHPQLTVIPDIDGEALAAMRKLCDVPADERVLGVLNLDQNGSKAALLVGCRGVYWRNGDSTPHPSSGAMSYEEMASRRFVNHGLEIYLGDGQYLCADEENSGVTTEALAGLLYQIRERMSPQERPSA